MEPLAFKRRPDSGLPVPFFLFGLAGLAAFLTAASLDPRAASRFPPGPHGVLLLHLAVLGWLTPVMIGAYYQLVPVVLQVPVPGARWGRVVLWGLLAGVLIFLGGWLRPDGVWIAAGGLLTGLAIYGFLAHMAASLCRLRRFSVPAVAFVLALLFLGATALIGPLLALAVAGDLAAPAFVRLLPAHAAAGLGGWLLLSVVGASDQLVPFFAATQPAVRPRFGMPAVVAVAVGAAGLAVGDGLAGAGGGVLLAGLGCWAWDLARLARHGRQARREPVVGFTGLAVAALLAAACGGEALLLGWRAPGGSVSALAVLGLVVGPALLVLGQLQKILPFLASLDVALAAKRVGKVPKTEALFPRRTAFGLLLPLTVGLFGLVAAVAFGGPGAVRVAGAVAALATYTYLAVQLRAVRTWLRARRPPLAEPRPDPEGRVSE